jgi:hypothetical protein
MVKAWAEVRAVLADGILAARSSRRVVANEESGELSDNSKHQAECGSNQLAAAGGRELPVHAVAEMAGAASAAPAALCFVSRYFMILDKEPGNAQVATSRRSALIVLANCGVAMTLDDVTCPF